MVKELEVNFIFYISVFYDFSKKYYFYNHKSAMDIFKNPFYLFLTCNI